MQVRLAHRNWGPVGAMYVVYQIEWFQVPVERTRQRDGEDDGRSAREAFPYSSACTPMESRGPVDLPQKPISTASAGPLRAAIER
jgi:hypothetical protein